MSILKILIGKIRINPKFVHFMYYIDYIMADSG